MRYALVPALALFVGPLAVYALIWGIGPLLDVLVTVEALLLTLAGFVALIIAHEVVHAVGWMIAGRLPPRSIRFGIDRKTLSPYARAMTPLRARAYRIGAALPLLVTGIAPWLLALFTADARLAMIAALLISGAVGDLYVLWAIREVPGQARVLDHPSSAGCYVLPD